MASVVLAKYWELFLPIFLDDSTRRIAYAASFFGTDLWEISPDLTPKIAAHAKKFHAISVREQSGIELCRKHLE